MAYIGNTPAEKYISISSQTFTTINGTGYTLSSSVTNSEDIALFLNNVRQKPSTYTATGTALTMGTATTTADALYCVYLGKGIQTVNPPAGSVGTTSIADDAVTTAKILNDNVTYAKIQDTTTANRVIGAATAGEVSEVQVVDDMTNFVSTASASGLQIKGDGTTDGTLQLNCSQNSHGVKIKSPAHSTAQSYTLTLPGAAPAVNKFIETDGSGNLSFSSVDVTTDITGTVPTGNLGTGTADSTTFLRGDQTYAEAGGGKLLQLVSSTLTAVATTTSTAFADSGLEVAITPTATSSKIFIMATIAAGGDNNDGYSVYTLTRGATNLGDTTAGFGELQNDDTARGLAALSYLDSPSTTSETTYKVYFRTTDANNDAAVSLADGASTITVMEIGA